MLRDPSGSDAGSTSEACDICRQLGNYRYTRGVPRDMSGGARLLLHENLQQKTRFLLPEKEVAGWPLEDFPKNEYRINVKIVRTVQEGEVAHN